MPKVGPAQEHLVQHFSQRRRGEHSARGSGKVVAQIAEGTVGFASLVQGWRLFKGPEEIVVRAGQCGDPAAGGVDVEVRRVREGEGVGVRDELDLVWEAEPAEEVGPHRVRDRDAVAVCRLRNRRREDDDDVYSVTARLALPSLAVDVDG